MQSFRLDEFGDVIVENDQLEMISNNDLLCQKVRQVLSTNLGEYELDKEQGIHFRNILGKQLNEDLVRDEILRGLRQVDSTFTIESFDCKLSKKRNLQVEFTAKTEKGESIFITKIYS